MNNIVPVSWLRVFLGYMPKSGIACLKVYRHLYFRYLLPNCSLWKHQSTLWPTMWELSVSFCLTKGTSNLRYENDLTVVLILSETGHVNIYLRNVLFLYCKLLI